MKRLLKNATIILLMISFNQGFAKIKLASPFQDHMVLQREMKVPIWGTAASGEKVTIQFGTQTHTVVTGKDGKWILKLDPLKAGGPFILKVNGTNELLVEDVYVGEVWLCSGQSNMDFTVAREDRYWCGVNNEAEEVANANAPLIRVLDIDFTPSETPQEEINGKWEVISPQTVGHISAIAYFFARDIQKKLKIPIGLITTAFGASTAEAWISKEALTKNEKFDKLLSNFEEKLIKFKADTVAQSAYKVAFEKWEIAAAKAKAAGKDELRGPKNPNPVRDQHNPYVLWNGMVKPLVPYAIRGALWYQGESNSPTASIYKDIMETLINDWRTQWKQGDFPFYFVQLANIGKEIDTIPAKGGSEAIKRDAQLQNLSIPNTGMAVAIDNADPDNMGNVHPKNKQEIGRRLSLIALANVYQNNVDFSGPIYNRMEINGKEVRLYFKHVDGGLTAKDGKLSGFAIAGEDKKFIWGNARIEGDHLVVSSPEVEHPVAVRYGWSSNPPISLYNQAQLPASPFKTDE